MNTQQKELYQNIQKFSLDDADEVLSFNQRLAKDNGWTIEYTQRVINEYKKFAFLAMIAGHPVSPSSQVDQAWHLHLTYTHSYWDEFCGKILHKSLHHNPSSGGYGEQEKYRRWYNETLISYEKIFHELPPIDIWPPSNIRFAQNVQYQRMNTRGYWIIPKPSLNFLRLPGLKAILIALLSFILVLAMSSFFPLLANTHNYSNNWNSSEFVISQTAENNPLPSNILYILGILSFVVGIFLSSRPVFVHPMKSVRIKGYDDHDIIVHFASFIGFFCIILPFMPNILKLLYNSLYGWLDSHTFLGYIYFLCYFIGGICIVIFVIFVILCILKTFFLKLIGILLKTNSRKSLRPIYCEKCKQELSQINSLFDLLNEKEIIARRIKSIYFEAWYCQSCCRKIERHSIHLRAYVSLSDEFKFCQDCNEVTMTKTSRIIKEATTKTGGKILIIYTCKCCYKKEEEIFTTPIIDDSACCA